MTMPDYVVPIDIRFADLDALGHVNSTTVFEYAEHARVNWLLDVAGAESSQRLPIIVASAHAEYKAPIAKSAQLDVVLTVSRIGTKSWEFDYALRERDSGLVYATVQTVQVAYDYGAAKSVPIEAKLRAKLEQLIPPERVNR